MRTIKNASDICIRKESKGASKVVCVMYKTENV